MDDEKKSAKLAKRLLLIISIVVVGAIILGFYQMGKAISNKGSENAQELISDEPQEEENAPIDSSEVEGEESQYTGPANLDEGDDGVVGGTNTFDFGVKEELPLEVSSPEGASVQILDSTYAVEEQIGLKGTPVTDINECSYYSKGYVACPVGGPYVQIIDSFYYQPFAYAKKGDPMPQNVMNSFRKVHPDAIEGSGEGAFEGYYIISRGIAQDLSASE